MAAIASNVQWGTGPNTYFDFSYEKKREGSTQYYKVTVSCDPITGGSYFGYPIYVRISLDGTEKAAYTLKAASPSQWSSAISYTTDWLPVSNKTSGTTALKIRIYSGLGSSRDTTYTYNLDIDPAASSISCTTANIESKPTITISRASSSFTHTVAYKFGSLSGTIATKTSETSITWWTIPASFYGQIPNAKTGYGTLTCTTYSGSTIIGASTCTFHVGTDETICKPSVSGTVVDINPKTIAVTGADDVIVRYHSKALCTISTALNKNAGSIEAKTINNTAVSGNTLEIPNVETGVFEFWAKDSREYPNSDKVVMTIIPYVKLTANVEGQRTDPTSGNVTLKVAGNYYANSFGAKDNELTIKYRVWDGPYIEVTPNINAEKNEYSVTVPLGGFTYTASWGIEVVVSDALETITRTITIPKGIPVFDWGENDFSFNVPVSIMGNAIHHRISTVDELDSFGFGSASKLNIGSGIVNIDGSYYGCLAFSIGWIGIQFRASYPHKVERRVYFGDNGWSEWVAM